MRYHKDGQRVYMITNKGDDVDLTRLVLFNPATGEQEFVESDPLRQVDLENAIFSDVTDDLIATVYVGDRVRIYPKNTRVERDLEVLREKLPEGELSFTSSTEDEDRWIVYVSRDVDPGSAYLYNRQDESVEFLYSSRPNLPSEHLASMRPVRYRTRDGLEVPGYLTLPKNVEGQKVAVVVFPHGGPWARDQWGYDAYAQFLANRGYAVFQPNFRGSTGYGKSFLNAGNNEWGTGAMQHDITDGIRYLIAEQRHRPRPRRDLRRILRRLRHTGRSDLHAGTLCRRRLLRGTVEPPDPVGRHSAVLETDQGHLRRPAGQPGRPGGPRPPGRTVAALLGGTDHGCRC